MFLAGQKVRIRATDDFYGYVDGRAGVVTGARSGYVEVECEREPADRMPGKLHFLVPPDQLEKLGQS